MLFQRLGQLSVGLFLGPVLLVDVDGLSGVVVAHAAEVVRVRVPAEVQTIVAPVEPGNLLAGDGPQLQVLEHGRAAAPHLARVPLFEGLGVVEEARAQPFGRGGQVGGMVPELLRLWLPLVPVDPVAGHGRGVEGLERKAERAAAEHRLLDVSHFLRAVVLVELLKVHDAEIAKRHRNGFQLAGVVQAVELDGLPGRDIGQGVGLFGLLPQVSDAHAVDDAVVFRPDTGGKGVAHLTQHHGVDIRHPHHQQHHLGGGKSGLERAAPAVAQVLVVLAGPDGGMGGVVFRDDQAA